MRTGITTMFDDHNIYTVPLKPPINQSTNACVVPVALRLTIAMVREVRAEFFRSFPRLRHGHLKHRQPTCAVRQSSLCLMAAKETNQIVMRKQRKQKHLRSPRTYVRSVQSFDHTTHQHERTNERANKRTNERTNEQTNERTNL